MITNTGVEIISKFLVGQATSYASHIAIGCGPRPLLSGGLFNVSPEYLSGQTFAGTVSYVGPDGSSGYYITMSLTGPISYIQIGDSVNVENETTNEFFVATIVGFSGSDQTPGISMTTTDPFGGNVIVSDVVVIHSLANQNNNQIFFKDRLDFEMARFPIKSSSYVIDRKVVICSSASNNANSDILTFTSLSPHNLNIGDKITASGFKTFSNGSYDINVYIQDSTGENQYYVIESAPTPTTFTVRLLDVQYDAKTYTAAAGQNAKVTAYIPQISFIAEVSDINSYEITEIGLYSSGSNSYSSGSDSRVLLNFGQAESWQVFSGESVTPVLYTNALESNATGQENWMSPFTNAVFVSSADKFFSERAIAPRAQRFEKPRMLGDGLVIDGSLSTFSTVGFNAYYTPSSTSPYLQVGKGFALSNNSDTDELRLAYSVSPKKPNPTQPTLSRIYLKVVSSNGKDYIAFRFYHDEFDGLSLQSGNRYVVDSVPLSSGERTAGFTWEDATSVQIFAYVDSSDYTLVLDGLRFENNNNNNPLYGLTAYTGISDVSINKQSNTSNLLEFRIEMDVNR